MAAVALERSTPMHISSLRNIDMPRGTTTPSEVFRKVLADARQEVLMASSKAGAFQHHGIRGDERAAGLARFLHEHLPKRFGVGKGEVLDYRDARTGQLDIILYDAVGCGPLSVQSENLLLPCEALYAIIEVKSILTGTELDKAYAAAEKVRRLSPFKAQFVARRRTGSSAEADAHRCMYIVFGYTSDLRNDSEWLDKEYARITQAASRSKADLDCVDRVVVLDRGIINPSAGRGKSVSGDDQSVFLDAYLHLVNFLARESRRREPVDWQIYGPRTAQGWRQLTPSSNPVQPPSGARKVAKSTERARSASGRRPPVR